MFKTNTFSQNFNRATQRQIVTAIIGSAEATELLKRNDGNRVLNRATIEEYAGYMRRKEWRWDGTPIQFDKNGRLLNGQHRLYAVIESGTEQEFTFVLDLDSDVFKNIDRGRRRTMTDLHTFSGRDNNSTISAVAGLRYRIEKNKLWARQVGSFDEQNEILNRFPGLEEACNLPKLFKQLRGLLEPSTVAYLANFLAMKDPEVAAVFLNKLAYGANLTVDNPIYVLRERLQGDVKHGRKTQQIIKLALCVKVWNKFNSGESIGCLRWNAGGKSSYQAEDFPEIDGANKSSKWVRTAMNDEPKDTLAAVAAASGHVKPGNGVVHRRPNGSDSITV